MIKMYTLDEKGILQIMEIPFNTAMLIIQKDPLYKWDYGGIKFLTRGEFETCSEMNNEQRKLYYELKEN